MPRDKKQEADKGGENDKTLSSVGQVPTSERFGISSGDLRKSHAVSSSASSGSASSRAAAVKRHQRTQVSLAEVAFRHFKSDEMRRMAVAALATTSGTNTGSNRTFAGVSHSGSRGVAADGSSKSKTESGSSPRRRRKRKRTRSRKEDGKVESSTFVSDLKRDSAHSFAASNEQSSYQASLGLIGHGAGTVGTRGKGEGSGKTSCSHHVRKRSEMSETMLQGLSRQVSSAPTTAGSLASKSTLVEANAIPEDGIGGAAIGAFESSVSKTAARQAIGVVRKGLEEDKDVGSFWGSDGEDARSNGNGGDDCNENDDGGCGGDDDDTWVMRRGGGGSRSFSGSGSGSAGGLLADSSLGDIDWDEDAEEDVVTDSDENNIGAKKGFLPAKEFLPAAKAVAAAAATAAKDGGFRDGGGGAEDRFDRGFRYPGGGATEEQQQANARDDCDKHERIEGNVNTVAAAGATAAATAGDDGDSDDEREDWDAEFGFETSGQDKARTISPHGHRRHPSHALLQDDEDLEREEKETFSGDGSGHGGAGAGRSPERNAHLSLPSVGSGGNGTSGAGGTDVPMVVGSMWFNEDAQRWERIQSSSGASGSSGGTGGAGTHSGSASVGGSVGADEDSSEGESFMAAFDKEYDSDECDDGGWLRPSATALAKTGADNDAMERTFEGEGDRDGDDGDDTGTGGSGEQPVPLVLVSQSPRTTASTQRRGLPRSKSESFVRRTGDFTAISGTIRIEQEAADAREKRAAESASDDRVNAGTRKPGAPERRSNVGTMKRSISGSLQTERLHRLQGRAYKSPSLNRLKRASAVDAARAARALPRSKSTMSGRPNLPSGSSDASSGHAVSGVSSASSTTIADAYAPFDGRARFKNNDVNAGGSSLTCIGSL